MILVIFASNKRRTRPLVRNRPMNLQVGHPRGDPKIPESSWARGGCGIRIERLILVPFRGRASGTLGRLLSKESRAYLQLPWLLEASLAP